MRIGVVVACAACAALPLAAIAEDSVLVVGRAYFAAATAATTTDAARPSSAATAKPAGSYTLLLTDVDVRRAFERWGRERGVAVRWLVERDHLIDAAAGKVEPRADVFQQASARGSADAELVAAMAQVAWAFRGSSHPFVIREYDNIVVVQPRSADRE